MPRYSALIVEDDAGLRDSLGLLVGREGYDVRYASNRAEAQRLLAEASADVVLLDLGLPDGDGIELLRDEELAVRSDFIVMTGNASVESAVQALRVGSLDYLTKPVDRDRLRTLLAGVTRTRQYRAEARGLREELRMLGRFGRLVGRSTAMNKVYDLIERVAPTEASVLLTGESGTGKELAAETIHLLSRRRGSAFLGVNSSAVSSTLIESELFGHEKGSFTGADNRRRGYFEEATGGTLFLDEITEMPQELQVKLLRVLETSKVTRVGGNDPITVDVRVVAASNRKPEEAVAKGKLREDLLYRLNVFPIPLPPLRDRREDVDLLAEHFLALLNKEHDTTKEFTRPALNRLRSHGWPGNVRELKNLVHRAFILAEDHIGLDCLPLGVQESAGSSLNLKVGTSLGEAERRLILATLEEAEGDKKKAAEILGISLKTLYNRLNEYKSA